MEDWEIKVADLYSMSPGPVHVSAVVRNVLGQNIEADGSNLFDIKVSQAWIIVI